MSPPHPINVPAGFAPAFAMGFADAQGDLSIIDAAHPLPVMQTAAEEAARPDAVAGTATQSALAGPFSPVPGVPVTLSLAGDWEGTVTLQRSVDGGTTRHPVTLAGMPWASFSGNANEPVWVESEAAIHLYLDIVLTGGTLDYRIAQ